MSLTPSPPAFLKKKKKKKKSCQSDSAAAAFKKKSILHMDMLTIAFACFCCFFASVLNRRFSTL